MLNISLPSCRTHPLLPWVDTACVEVCLCVLLWEIRLNAYSWGVYIIGVWVMPEPREIRILNHSEMTTTMFIKQASRWVRWLQFRWVNQGRRGALLHCFEKVLPMMRMAFQVRERAKPKPLWHKWVSHAWGQKENPPVQSTKLNKYLLGVHMCFG